MILPRGLQLLSPDGTFYNLETHTNPPETPDHYMIGIMDPSGVLRPFFLNRIIVKVRRNGPGDFDVVPLTLQEFMFHNYHQDSVSRKQHDAQYIEEVINRHRG